MNHTEPMCAEIIYLIFVADINKMRRMGIFRKILMTSFQRNNKISVTYTSLFLYTCIVTIEILGLLSQCASDLVCRHIKILSQ